MSNHTYNMSSASIRIRDRIILYICNLRNHPKTCDCWRTFSSLNFDTAKQTNTMHTSRDKPIENSAISTIHAKSERIRHSAVGGERE